MGGVGGGGGGTYFDDSKKDGQIHVLAAECLRKSTVGFAIHLIMTNSFIPGTLLLTI
jgi:hypothetical protein